MLKTTELLRSSDSEHLDFFYGFADRMPHPQVVERQAFVENHEEVPIQGQNDPGQQFEEGGGNLPIF